MTRHYGTSVLYWANLGDSENLYTGSPDTPHVNPHSFNCYDWFTTAVQETYIMSQTVHICYAVWYIPRLPPPCFGVLGFAMGFRPKADR